MPTYEYACDACGQRFERFQRMSDPPVERCPACGGAVRRLPGAGVAAFVKGSGGGTCSLRDSGRTCCGRDTRCDKPSCGG